MSFYRLYHTGLVLDLPKHSEIRDEGEFANKAALYAFFLKKYHVDIKDPNEVTPPPGYDVYGGSGYFVRSKLSLFYAYGYSGRNLVQLVHTAGHEEGELLYLLNKDGIASTVQHVAKILHTIGIDLPSDIEKETFCDVVGLIALGRRYRGITNEMAEILQVNEVPEYSDSMNDALRLFHLIK